MLADLVETRFCARCADAEFYAHRLDSMLKSPDWALIADVEKIDVYVSCDSIERHALRLINSASCNCLRPQQNFLLLREDAVLHMLRTLSSRSAEKHAVWKSSKPSNNGLLHLLLDFCEEHQFTDSQFDAEHVKLKKFLDLVQREEATLSVSMVSQHWHDIRLKYLNRVNARSNEAEEVTASLIERLLSSLFEVLEIANDASLKERMKIMLLPRPGEPSDSRFSE